MHTYVGVRTHLCTHICSMYVHTPYSLPSCLHTVQENADALFTTVSIVSPTSTSPTAIPPAATPPTATLPTATPPPATTTLCRCSVNCTHGHCSPIDGSCVCVEVSSVCVVLGVWCVVLGVWCVVLGVWCVVLGVWCVVLVWCVAECETCTYRMCTYVGVSVCSDCSIVCTCVGMEWTELQHTHCRSNFNLILC